MSDPAEGRTGRPEIDDLLDLADAEERALTETSAVNQAENVVAASRQDDLAAEHKALHERCRQTEEELQAAKDSGDADRIAAARAAREEANAEFARRSPVLIAEAQQLLGARLERSGEFLDQMGTVWRSQARAHDALAGRRAPEAEDPRR
ncbi:hypothetical protein [Streptosporangium jomthongense]|uniref:ATPase n=1 Tax=Streptosporangium jomthongense TaxID=1193683 RepID=A0ABV8FG57_9ACTN